MSEGNGNGNGRMVRVDRGGSLMPVEAHLAAMQIQAALQAEATKMGNMIGPVANAIQTFMDSQRPGAFRAATRMDAMGFSCSYEVSIEVSYGS